jgi:hypothetical protein
LYENSRKVELLDDTERLSGILEKKPPGDGGKKITRAAP